MADWRARTLKMSENNQAPAPLSDRNAFLAELPPAEYQLLRPHLRAIALSEGARLHDMGQVIEDVVFPDDGLVALILPLGSKGGGGAILVGRDGFVGGLEVAAGATAACDAEVYIAGRAACMPASAFRAALDQSAAVRRIASRFEAALLLQAQQTALCNAAHSVQARISRWLLEVLDRTGAFEIPLTQAKLAHMLGVRRTTLNNAVGPLVRSGIIKSARGRVRVIRREELEQHACECYRSLKGDMSLLSGSARLNIPDALPARGKTPKDM